jgi:hypothetical protein
MSPSDRLDVLKILASFIGAVLGGVGAFLLKEIWLDRRKQRDREKQTRWLPLFAGAQDFKTRLDDLASKYEGPTNVWCEWTSSSKRTFRLPTEARDFHELYLLDANPQVIDESFTLIGDPGGARESESAVKRIRSRIHELNYATISLYRTARYLGYAQRVRRELEQGQLIVPATIRDEVIGLLLSVRRELNGTSERHLGAGIVDDLQDLVGESVWGEDDRVISYHEFRERLIAKSGWEQFTDLFRFFVHFHMKVDTEVEKTREALKHLCSISNRVVGSSASFNVPKKRQGLMAQFTRWRENRFPIRMRPRHPEM